MDLGPVEGIFEQVGIRHRARDRASQRRVRDAGSRAFDGGVDQWNAPGPRSTALLIARSSPSTKQDVSNSRARSRDASALQRVRVNASSALRNDSGVGSSYSTPVT